MKFGPIEVTDKLGRTIVLRSAEIADGDALIEYLKVTAGETPYLIREPEEVIITPAQEEAFIQSRIDDTRGLMLVATIDGEHIGTCSLSSVAPFERYAHRCDVSIAIYQKYWGAGIGELMMNTILTIAKNLGYEQAELEVIADNAAARSLYQKLGFEEYGRFPHNMKYQDGTYADAIWMMKRL